LYGAAKICSDLFESDTVESRAVATHVQNTKALNLTTMKSDALVNKLNLNLVTD
jgi:hypothetical protein